LSAEAGVARAWLLPEEEQELAGVAETPRVAAAAISAYVAEGRARQILPEPTRV